MDTCIFKKLPAMVGALTLVGSMAAQAVVIDFEAGVFGSQVNATGSTYNEDGFDFRTPDVSGMHYHLFTAALGNDPAGPAPGALMFHNGIGNNSVLTTVRLTNSNDGTPGAAFDLNSFDILGTGYSRFWVDPLGLTPWRSSEVTITSSNGDLLVIPADVFDGVNDTPDRNFVLNWTGVTWVDFVSDPSSSSSAGLITMLDNVVINEVPVPAAAWLFMSAISGLTAARYKKK